MFEAIKTKKLVIIFESCYSGRMIDGADDIKKTSRIIITSTNVNETSYSYSLFFSKKWLSFDTLFNKRSRRLC